MFLQFELKGLAKQSKADEHYSESFHGLIFVD
jgi:hypothetical protein